MKFPQAIAKTYSRGVALITAMLIFALVTVIATNLQWDTALDVRRTMVLLNRDQAIQVALGAESWAMNFLRQDLSDGSTDHLGEIWASDLPPLPFEGGEAFAAITDLQGRFNINNLTNQNGEVDTEMLDQFTRLLEALEIDPRFAGITADWLDKDQDAGFPDGAEDAIYSTLIPPYQPPNRPITSVSELAALDGMEGGIFRSLEEHIAALPPSGSGQPTKINVNTATPAVLQSLDEQISVADVERLVSEREESGFADVNTTFGALVPPKSLVAGTIAENTEYFQLKVVVRVDTVRITLISILNRNNNGAVAAVSRSFGAF